jgi:hypothetical protein
LIHECEIHGDTTVGRGEIAFERGTAREGNDGNAVFVADFGDLGNFLSGFWVGDCDGQTIDIG